MKIVQTTEKTMKEAIVLYPLQIMSHLLPMIELGKLILTYKPSISIHILIASEPYTTPQSSASYIANIAGTIPSIYFHHLASTNLETQGFEVLRLNNPHVHQTLLSISKSHTINSLIIDFSCAVSLSVASQLNIPAYFFYPGCAGSLAVLLYLPIIHQNTTKSFKDLNIFLDFPGLPPILSSDMPMQVLHRYNKDYESILDIAITLPKSLGIITNTFELLESKALKAISDGLCVPNSTTPPIYCVGPLIMTNNPTDGGHEPECLTWLDSQRSQSVIFLCFGSLGLFSKEQLREMAIGLERSRQRFLWVVRNPSSNNQSYATSPQPDPDFDSLFPDGFLDRTKERGLVVKSWAPQLAVLNHKSVGGFVTHCGWNSVLEAVCAGVPMVAWPLYAEQKVNRVLLVKEMKIALAMNESENGLVTALEVEKRVSELMDSELGKSVREQTIAMKNAAKAALREDGSSRVALSQLIESWNKHP